VEPAPSSCTYMESPGQPGPGWTGEERLGGEQLVVLEAEP